MYYLSLKYNKGDMNVTIQLIMSANTVSLHYNFLDNASVLVL